MRLKAIILVMAFVLCLAGCSKSDITPSIDENSPADISSIVSESVSSEEESENASSDITSDISSSTETPPSTSETVSSEESDNLDSSSTPSTSGNTETPPPDTEPVSTDKENESTTVTTTSKESSTSVPKEEDMEHSFIKTSGKILVDENGQEYIIKGMAFGNDIWSNPDTPPEFHHTEKSYEELAEMGFNSVRFYLNYGLFESDDDPYTYKESGFEWLDKNIEQAEKYGIKLLLNMHYPQGGYQSQGKGDALWLVEANQKRLTALWTEIAKRYCDEPAILGYGLVNEPVVAVQKDGEGLAKWQKLAQQITDSIRTADTNHIIFVEKMCAEKNINTGVAKWQNFNDENNYVRINDDNVVYEFHYYTPHMYTHQGFDWADTEGISYVYPDKDFAMAFDSVWATSAFGGDKANLTDNVWQYLESDFLTVDDISYKMLGAVFQAARLGVGGKVYADNLKIDEYDENGNFVKTIYFNDFKKGNDLYFWSADGSGSGTYSTTVGYDDNTSLCIEGTTDDANFSKNTLVAVYGHKYKASGYFKVEAASTDAVVMPRVDAWLANYLYVLDKEYIEYSLLENIEFSKDNNVPVYCGEFGAGVHCFTGGRGGVQWVSDVIDVFLKHNISFNYHTYHEESFGLYQNSSLHYPAKRNEPLYRLFVSKLS